MNMDWLNGATQRERDQFKSVCNQLLSRTATRIGIAR